MKLWPDVFNSDEAEAKKDAVIEGMRVARPVIETGSVLSASASHLVVGVTSGKTSLNPLGNEDGALC